MDSYNDGDAGIIGDYYEVLAEVGNMKQDYGNGVSTLIIVENQTGKYLNLKGSSHDSGRFYTTPKDIPEGKSMGFLHIKKNATCCGSVGQLNFYFMDNGRREFRSISWDTPHYGTNTCSRNGTFIRNGSSATIKFTIY